MWRFFSPWAQILAVLGGGGLWWFFNILKITQSSTIFIVSPQNFEEALRIFKKIQKFRNTKIVYCPPYTILEKFVKKTKKTKIKIGAQNCHYDKNFGAYTGSINAMMIKQVGAKFISYIIGKKIHDATSGFRVYSSRSIEALFSTNSFTYTLETFFTLFISF